MVCASGNCRRLNRHIYGRWFEVSVPREKPTTWVAVRMHRTIYDFFSSYWYLPIEIAAGMFSGIYDPFHNTFPVWQQKT
jgi:hypothetical protein